MSNVMVFFFFKQKTAYEIKECDWSSDVCSSDLFSDRYERGSVLVTTNLDFGSWQEIFGDERLTGALLDRLTHRCHIFQFQGESYRFKESQKRLKKKGEGGK